MITCRTCRQYIPGYLQRDLPPSLRAEVAEHLQDCDACYALSVQQRDFSRELTHSLPSVGSSVSGLDRIWSAVQADMAHPRREPAALDRARYGIVALIFVIALLLPWTVRGQRLALPTPPTPAVSTPRGTPVGVAFAPYTITFSSLTPQLQSNNAPELGATDTP